VTPSKPYYTFTPTYAYFSSLSGSQTANFTATATQYTISGANRCRGRHHDSEWKPERNNDHELNWNL